MFLRRVLSGLVVGAAFIAAGGCSIMPVNGPASGDVRSGTPKEPESLPYALVKLTPDALGVLAENTPRFSTAFPDRRPPTEIRFGIGDVVSVTIFESAAGGL